jgi:hypothetical protein
LVRAGEKLAHHLANGLGGIGRIAEALAQLLQEDLPQSLADLGLSCVDRVVE